MPLTICWAASLLAMIVVKGVSWALTINAGLAGAGAAMVAGLDSSGCSQAATANTMANNRVADDPNLRLLLILIKTPNRKPTVTHLVIYIITIIYSQSIL